MADRKTVLLVEDNIKLNESNRRALEMQGYEVLTALTLEHAREHLNNCDPDVILLDVMLPDGDGIEFCNEIYGTVTSHIIFLTAKTDEENRIKGLESGGDDYISKPFKLEEMVARVGAAMRRREQTPADSNLITLGDLTLNTLTQRAYWRGEDLNLQAKEFVMLRLLVSRRDRYTSTEALYKELWGMEAIDVRVVKQNIYRIRKNFDDNEVSLTIDRKRGQGYRLLEGAPSKAKK